MYHVKRIRGSFKGAIGEYLFQATDNRVALTRFIGKKKWFSYFEKYLTQDQRNFLDTYWFSLDAVKVNHEPKPGVLIFEIKTRNRYQCPKPNWTTVFSRAAVQIYQKALLVGFEVRVVTVWLEDDWQYSLEFEDFNKAKYTISAAKLYDPDWSRPQMK